MNTSAENATGNTAEHAAQAEDAREGADTGGGLRVPAPTVWPLVQANDALALIDFLVDSVGFLRTAVFTEGGKVAHAELSWPEGGGVMVSSYDPDSDWARKPGTFGAYVVTAEIDALYERLRARGGITFVRKIADQDYGSRDFTLKDPEGNLWSFGTYRGEPRP